MNGSVDDTGRALLSVALQRSAGGAESTFDAWIDTGFIGDLVLPRELVESLGLPEGYSIRAVLADGSETQVKTYRGELDWFGHRRIAEVVINDGQFPLLGVGLLRGHKLTIDYTARTLTLD